MPEVKYKLKKNMKAHDYICSPIHDEILRHGYDMVEMILRVHFSLPIWGVLYAVPTSMTSGFSIGIWSTREMTFGVSFEKELEGSWLDFIQVNLHKFNISDHRLHFLLHWNP